jgi:methylated-DNA-[protein]-cysteine S-methyltransferase
MQLLVDSPVGPLGVVIDGDTVVGVRFGAPASSGSPGVGSPGVGSPGVGSPGVGSPGVGSHPVVDELTAYFAGTLTAFSVPVERRGGSDFEQAVWGRIADIPYGEMQTYGAIATALGDPTLARAVGTACNHNPVPIFVPCHRVVGAGGKMVGFGGGIERKRRLLELEARVALERTWR